MRCLKIRKFENIFCYKHNKMFLLLSVRSNILQEDINHGKTVQFRIKALAQLEKYTVASDYINTMNMNLLFKF